jgi:hypothetical protein
MAANDQQVQQYVNERYRPFAEQMRAVYTLALDHKAMIDDVYDAVDPPEEATWTDNRTDGPPYLLDAQDVLSFNSFITMFIAFVEGELTDQNKNVGGIQWPVLMKGCVRGVLS